MLFAGDLEWEEDEDGKDFLFFSFLTDGESSLSLTGVLHVSQAGRLLYRQWHL